MKKYLALFISIFTIASAKEIEIKYDYTQVRVRSAATINSKILGHLKYPSPSFTLKGYISGDGCSEKWANINYKGTNAFVCSTYTQEVPIVEDENFNKTLKNFPVSYHEPLKKLHAKHPNWHFKRINTYTSWDKAVKEQVGRKLLQITNDSNRGLLILEGSYFDPVNDYYTVNGSTWYYPNEETIAYYMDPRNYLNEPNILAFQSLFFNNYENVSTVKKIGKNTTYIASFADLIYNISKEVNISSYYAMSHAIQENGYNANRSTSGKTKGYEGYYNFYNIGANDNGDKAINGLNRAKSEGWDTPAKSIRGGLSFIQDFYIGKNQHTPYSFNFNVHHNRVEKTWHQYMTNVRATMSTARINYNSLDEEMRNLNYTFHIPVYNGMPNKAAKLPDHRNPNNFLKSININGKPLKGFTHDTFTYTYPIADTIPTINISASAASSKAKVQGTGNINIINKNYLEIICISEQGKKRTYRINFKKTSGGVGINIDEEIKKKNYNISKGYITNIGINKSKNIFINSFNNLVVTSVGSKTNLIGTNSTLSFSTSNNSKTYKALIYGDINGDGIIDILDLTILQLYLMNKTKLNADSFKLAADINRDGKTDILDLTILQLYLMNKTKISQRW